ncbi:fasciclin domain-containing protein [Granulosicoccus sp.]|nr:fasciclin domain-containing protein [Granulosicoccus sp.]MDB4224182.1 fasciclin domain-containing protein [Granulosicoccus sp.]
MINRKIIVLAALTAVTSFSPFFALAGGHGIMVGGAEMVATKNIIENASESADHTTLVAAVTAAELVELLQGEGPFTVLAPTNAAFDALPEGTVDNLLKPENIETLQAVLSCHVVAANAMAADVIKMIADDGGEHTVGTAGGCMLVAKYNDDKVTFTDENGNVATVTIADVAQKNGVIHVIDTVLLPKS